MDENVILLVFGQKLLSRVSEVMAGIEEKRPFPFLRLASNAYLLPIAAQKEMLDIFSPLGARNADFFLVQVVMRDAVLEKVTRDWIADRGITVDDERLSITAALELLGAWAKSKESTEDFQTFAKSVGSELDTITRYDLTADRSVSREIISKCMKKMRVEDLVGSFLERESFLADVYTRFKEPRAPG